jgi:hypothetical protein
MGAELGDINILTLFQHLHAVVSAHARLLGTGCEFEVICLDLTKASLRVTELCAKAGQERLIGHLLSGRIEVAFCRRSSLPSYLQ